MPKALSKQPIKLGFDQIKKNKTHRVTIKILLKAKILNLELRGFLILAFL
jgi:hypothetical protein